MRRLAVAMCFALIADSGRAQQPSYDAMIARRSSGGFQAALDSATDRLSADPNDATAAGVRALVYANAVDFLGMPNAQARQAKQSALADARGLSPSNSWTRAAFGLIHMFDDPKGAERELADCIDAAPDFLECYNLYGDLLRKQNRLDEAGQVYQRALDRWPEDGELIVSYALLLQQAGQTKAALERLGELTREQPDFARGHWHLAGMLYESGGDRKVALREARAALALDPQIWNGKLLLDALDVQPPPNTSLERTRER